MFPEKQAGTKALALLHILHRQNFIYKLSLQCSDPGKPNCLQALTYDVRRERDREKKDFMRGGAAACIQVCSLLVEGSDIAVNCLQQCTLSVKQHDMLNNEGIGD